MRARGAWALGAVLGPLLLCTAPNAADVENDAFGCPPAVAAYAGQHFVDTAHELWYRRFWTGACDGLPVFVCFSGRPYWADTLQRLVNKAVPEERRALRARLCTLGRRVGFEWAKENDVRVIDTKTVVEWTRSLEDAPNPGSVLDMITTEVDRRLGAP